MIYTSIFSEFSQKRVFDNSYVDTNDLATNKMLAKETEVIKSVDRISKSMKQGKAYSNVSSLVTTFDTTHDTDKTSLHLDNVAQLQNKMLFRSFSQDVVFQAILRTRRNQVLRYSRPARYDKAGAGFEIIPKDSNGLVDKPSKEQVKKILQYEEFISNTGRTYSPQRQGFAKYLSAFVDNRYVFDQQNTERVFTKYNTLDHFNAVDAGTVVFDKLPKSVDQPRRFIQYPYMNAMGNSLGKGIKFSEKELTFVTYNNDSSVLRHGYGYSEVEATLNVLRYHEDTEKFNSLFFSQGGTTRGILLIDSGDNSNAQQNAASLAALRRQWQSNFSGNNGAWKLPVISAHDAKYVNMTQSSKDMEFEKWLNYLINIECAVCQIQPEEINFPNRGGSTGKGTGNSVNEGSTTKAKMQQSRDKGLEPLLNYIEDFMNNEIMRYLDSNYMFRFTIGDTEEAIKQQDLLAKKLQTGMTLDESREAQGLGKLPAFDFDSPGGIPGGAAVLPQIMQLLVNQDSVMQSVQQHKNDNNPQAAANGQPEKGMPVDTATQAVKDDFTNNKAKDNTRSK